MSLIVHVYLMIFTAPNDWFSYFFLFFSFICDKPLSFVMEFCENLIFFEDKKNSKENHYLLEKVANLYT